MANQRARSPGRLAELNTHGQVSTKPGYAVDPNAGIWFTTANSLRRAGQALGNLADRAMKRQQQQAIATASDQGTQAGYSADLGTGATLQISDELRTGIQATAAALEVSPEDLATVISYETKGTFDPLIKGPTTKWGTHRGLIQFGEPQAQKYGVDWNNPIASQLGENGAIVRYLRDAGVKPGMGLLDIYSAINAGQVGRPNASDEAAGGAPGTVRDKVEQQMEAHKARAALLFAERHVAGTGRPSSSGPALALRRGDTPMGEAYTAAQNRAISRRLPIEVTQQLDALYEDHKDNPAELAAAFDEAENTVLGRIGQLTGNDPESIAFAKETFAKKRFGYEKSARAAEDARIRDGERADYDQTISDARNSLQKQAYRAANDEEAGESLSVSINENLASIESALDAGVISADVALRDRKHINDTVTLGRLDGTFDALPDIDSKKEFVEGLKESWTNGDELVKGLSLEQIQTLERKYQGAISSQNKAETATAKLQEQKMRGWVKDDLASIRSTGIGLSIDDEELTFDQVKGVLGEEFATNWQHNRQIQADLFKATSGLDVMSASDMQAHLQGLEPKAGTSGFTDQMAIHDTAQKEAQRILKQRKEDPALAVDNAFDELQPIREQAYEGDPVAMEELIKGRLEAQEAIGISDFAKAPLTNSELASVAMPVAKSTDRQVWQDLFGKLDSVYGIYADEVMSQILNWKGLRKEAAEVATAYLRKTQLGQVPSRREIAAANETVEQSLPAQALEGNMPLAATPNTNHIDYLLAHPETATDFDAKFGTGSSDKFLELQKNIERETAQKQTDARRAEYLAGPSMMQGWGPIHQQLLENQIIKNL
ncbi:hypothetical protein SAMN04488056_112170 [Cohaesibacter marisflavi]|uniref:Transglycosylase SLT domain-containing protein n=1 Tax=Cohaesibacter marisflavi TaxID=655353 RepID=A0A1I5JYS3_9HYPH|nr:hypothetical protein [Cohaesibacter marisflavi]SFO77962.1 hypothetical protein SAMN04488056_112170 [Cohaesibacter marisflavi]